MKRNLLRFVTALLLAACCLVCVFAEEDEDVSREGEGASCGDGLSWFFEDGVLTISGSGEMDDFEKGAPWADLKNSIRKVVLTDGVVSVGAYAFENYDQIREVDLGDSLKYLGRRCFAECDGLTSITLPKTFKKFDEECLRSCTNLTEIHCEGGFPRFETNCLWDTFCTIYYPADAPWSTIYIEQLETAFRGRIEFLDSNGQDHYTYVEPTTETIAPATAATESYTPAATVPETLPPIPAPTKATQPVTEPETEPETTVQTQPRETFLFGTEEPTRSPEPERRSGGGAIGIAIVGIVLSLAGLGALAFRRRDEY